MRSTLCVCVRGRVVCLGRGLGFPTSCVVLGSGGWVLLSLVRVPARRPPGPTHTQPRTHPEMSEKIAPQPTKHQESHRTNHKYGGDGQTPHPPPRSCATTSRIFFWIFPTRAQPPTHKHHVRTQKPYPPPRITQPRSRTVSPHRRTHTSFT